ncbi:MAG: glycosyltransferase [Paracoccaceae bacterium]
MTKRWTNSVEICVCTHRRKSLLEALNSLNEDTISADLPVSILVIDNDDAPTAQRTTNEFAQTSELPVRYLHYPGSNISIARNAALVNSHARFLAFLDDDETAGPNWLFELIEKISETSASVVIGPVKSLYDSNAAQWIRTLDTHSTYPVFVDGVIQTGYSCNVIVDRQSAALEGLEFDLSLGRSGGEDTAFFANAFSRGALIEYAPNAVVYEKVLAERAQFSWLAKRRFRMGQTHGKIIRKSTGTIQQIRSFLTAMSKVAYCATIAIIAAFLPAKRNQACLRGALHAGTASAFLGVRHIELYKTKTARTSQ